VLVCWMLLCFYDLVVVICRQVLASKTLAVWPSSSFIARQALQDKGVHVRIDSNRCVPIALRQQLRGSLRIGLCHLHHLADILLLLRRARSWHCGGRVSWVPGLSSAVLSW
jgi:hypothetical protein